MDHTHGCVECVRSLEIEEMDGESKVVSWLLSVLLMYCIACVVFDVLCCVVPPLSLHRLAFFFLLLLLFFLLFSVLLLLL